MTGWMIYLWTRLDVVNGFCTAGFVTSFIVIGFSLFFFLMKDMNLTIGGKRLERRQFLHFVYFQCCLYSFPPKRTQL